MKVALFGGTFDPCHEAHAWMAAETLRAGAADRVVVLPTVVTYHRKGKPAPLFTEGERLGILREYFKGDDRIIVDGTEYSVSEAERSGRRYVMSLKDAKVRYRGAFGPGEYEWLTVLGGDSLASFRTWTRWEEILSASGLVAFGRGGSGDLSESGLPLKASLRLPAECGAVSASAIRERLSGSADPYGEALKAAAQWRTARERARHEG